MRRFIFLFPVIVLVLAGSTSLFAGSDSGLLALIPSSATTVGGMDVARARNSPLGQYLLANSQTENLNFETLIQETGFDPRRDLEQVVFEASGTGAKGQKSFAILARGTFDEGLIKVAAKKNGAGVQVYEGVEMIVTAPSDHGNVIAFPESGLAVMADLKTMRQIIANRATPTVLDASLQSGIDAVSAGHDAWFVSTTGGGFIADRLRGETGHSDEIPQQSKVLDSIAQSSGGIRFGEVIEASFEAVTRSPQDATSLADVIRFATSMVQMQRQNDPRAAILASSLDSMKLQVTGNSVHFAVSMPEGSVEQLADLRPAAGKRARPNMR